MHLHKFVCRPKAYAAALLLLSLAGCGASQPARFYVLAPVQIEQPSHRIASASRLKGTMIGVGPIEIPKYLDRAALAVFTSDNHMELKEFDRWAEPLDDSVARAIAGNLMQTLPNVTVTTYPFSAIGRANPDYQIAVEILQMRIAREQIALSANWSITSTNGRRNVASSHFQVQRAYPANDMEAAVQALSSAIGALTEDIANKL